MGEIEEIRQFQKQEWRNCPIYLYEVIDSTNNMAKQLAREHTPHGTLVTANAQTAGRGRRGRTFFSPKDTGIYMSIVLEADTDFREGILYTTAAAVAVCRGLEQVLGSACQPVIKWVNDVFIDGKKVCGILAEAVMAGNSGGNISHVVVGIGINLSTEQFPEELQDIAGGIVPACTKELKARVIAAVYNELMEWAKAPSDASFMKEYRSRSFILNQQVEYMMDGIKKNGIAREITDKGELVLEIENQKGVSERITVNTGECSVKLTQRKE